jgi:outer membrane receptor protein involved in Fe transport
MRKILALLVLLIICQSGIKAQDFKIHGNIILQGKPIEAATISLLKTDSSQMRHAISNKSGVFEMDKIPEGNYLLLIQYVGCKPYYSDHFVLNAQHAEYDFKTITLSENAKLSDVVVSSKKQFIEQGIDKTIINIDASPTSVGLSALDLLEKTPGVTVDKDGNISLKGKQGVLVLIDGKPTYLSAQDLATMLKNMPSTMLDQFEVMTNPPAKYDAAGNSGIINIKTKKSKTKGFNTSVTVGGGMGKYAKANESINLNYRTGKINLFGNYSYSYNKRFQNLDLVRNFRDSITNNITSIYSQRSVMHPEYHSHNAKMGLDFYASKKTTLGIVLNGNFNPGNFSLENVTNINDVFQKLQTKTITNSSSNDTWKNYGVNFNTITKLDTAGTELSSSFDYIYYYSASNQLFNNYFYDENDNETTPAQILRGYTPGKINIYSGKIDYSHPMKNDTKLEAGIKSSYVTSDNIAQYDTLANGKWVNYEGRTNHFLYKENINAAYVNFSKKLNKKWSAQLGLRLENTNANGNQLTTGETFKRNYTQLFPTAYLNYKLNDNNQFNLNYGRRVQRPDYGDLNPFYYFLDPYTYQVGNPYLKPQFSHNIELSHSYKNMLTTTLSYTAVNDMISEQLQQIDSIHTTYVTRTNLAQQRSVTLSANAGVPVTKWWRTNVYVQGSYNRFKGFINQGMLDVHGASFNSNMQNQFTLPKGWSMELSGYFNSRAVYGTMIGLPQGAANFAVSKNILKDKGSIKVNFRDFLGLQGWRGVSRYQNIDVTIKNHWDSRVVNLSFTYRFNKGKGAEHRQNSAADEEQNRVKGGRG